MGELTCGRAEHDEWTVVRDGFYGCRPRRRQRYRCHHPDDPSDFHRFTPTVMRLEARGHRCLECENPLQAGQGPNTARLYAYAAREIAIALVAVANGNTYEQAALTARNAAVHADTGFPRDRVDRTAPGQLFGAVSGHGTLAASWVETFTDIVLGDPVVQMPRVLMLDSTRFWRHRAGQQVNAFAVLAAYGYSAGSDKGRLLRAAAYPIANAAAWIDFLSAMPGMPEVIVCDRGNDLRAAFDALWPKPGVGNRPERVACRWHLADNLRTALVKDLTAHVTKPKEHALYLSAERAFDSDESWCTWRWLAYRELLRLEPAASSTPAAVTWCTANDLLIRAQIARRPHRDSVESTAPLERELTWLRGHLARRAQTLRNQPRTNQMLRLIVAGRNGQANEQAWAERIRAWLAANSGSSPTQRQLARAAGL